MACGFPVAELVIHHYGPLAVGHHAVGAPRRSAARQDDFVLVAHHLPPAAEPLRRHRIREGLFDQLPQAGGLFFVEYAVLGHRFDGRVDLVRRRGVFEDPVHQDTEVARREFGPTLFLVVAFCRQPQLQLRLRRGVVPEQDVRGFRFPVRIRLRSGKFAEFVGFGGFVPGVAALQPVQPDRAVLRGDVLQDQLSDVRSLGSLLRDEDVQRFHGPCQGYVQQIDVVHVRVDHLPVIVGREERFAHAGFIPHRKPADSLQLPVRAFGPDDVRRESARFGIERPVAVGDQHYLFFQSLGLVYRGDFDGRFALFDAQRAAASLFVPPFEEEGNVGYAARAEVDDLFVHGLQVGDLLPSLLKVVPHDDPFERLFGREQPQRFEKDDLLFREFRIEGGFG